MLVTFLEFNPPKHNPRIFGLLKDTGNTFPVPKIVLISKRERHLETHSMKSFFNN